MRASNILLSASVRTTILTLKRFMSTEEEGGHFCITFFYNKFCCKMYPIGNAMNLWRLMDIRRKFCPQEAPLMCCDRTVSMLCTYGVKFHEDFPTMMSYRVSGRVSKQMLVTM